MPTATFEARRSTLLYNTCQRFAHTCEGGWFVLLKYSLAIALLRYNQNTLPLKGEQTGFQNRLFVFYFPILLHP